MPMGTAIVKAVCMHDVQSGGNGSVRNLTLGHFYILGKNMAAFYRCSENSHEAEL